MPQDPDCLFCKIASGAIPVEPLYQDEQVFAFRDIAPQAPMHFLVIPRAHLQSLAHTSKEHAPLLGHLLTVAADLAAQQGLSHGFRTIINSGRDGGQTVDHLHIHILGGRAMHWPPG
jgi:histidine triad (HIT) family protein